jgi:hypothetical protein
MPIPLWNNLDFRKQQALNMRLHYATAAPADALAGMIFFDSTAGEVKPKWYDGSAWVSIYKSSAIADGSTNALRDADGNLTANIFKGVAQKATILENSRNFSITGKATAAAVGFNGSGAIALEVTALSVVPGEISLTSGNFLVGNGSDKAAAVAKSDIPLSGFGLPAADLSLNSKKITNLAAPTDSTDAANKAYVDARIQGLDTKDSCRLATAAALPACTYNGTSLTLTGNANGVLTVDSVEVTVGIRVLVKNQTAAKDNGIYVVTQPGTPSTPFILTRADDFNSTASTPPKVTPGAYTWVEEGAVNGAPTGSVNAGTGWTVVTKAPITLGTTSINWAQFNGAGGVTVNSITYDKIQKLPALSVLGNSSNSEADASAIAGTVAGTVLRVSADGTTLGFGKFNLSQSTVAGEQTIEGVLPYAFGGTGNAFFQVVGPAQSGKSYSFPNRQSSIPAYKTGTFDGGAATAYDATHNLNTKDVLVILYDKDDNVVLVDTKNKDANTVTFTFGDAPTAAAGTFRWTAVGY